MVLIAAEQRRHRINAAHENEQIKSQPGVPIRWVPHFWPILPEVGDFPNARRVSLRLDKNREE
jgi:hypothetical protein